VLEHLDDVGVPGEPQRFRLSSEPVRSDGVVRDGGSQKLDRDRRVVGQARGLMNDSARPGSQLAAEAVLARDDRALEKSDGRPLAILFERNAALQRANAVHLRVRFGTSLTTGLPGGTHGSRNRAGAEHHRCAEHTVIEEEHRTRPRRRADRDEQRAPSVGDTPAHHVLFGNGASPRQHRRGALARQNLHGPSAETEEGGHRRELRSPRQRTETIALDDGIVRENHAAVPEPRSRLDLFPP
jgi:hypothetical protein